VPSRVLGIAGRVLSRRGGIQRSVAGGSKKEGRDGKETRGRERVREAVGLN